MLPDLVSSAVGGDGALLGADLLVAVRLLHDVVFNQWVGGPSVHGQDAYSSGAGEGAGVVDGAG